MQNIDLLSLPRLVQNQMSQIQVMKEEFNEKQPNKDRFNDIGETVLETAGDSPDARKVEDKLDNINKKWDDLLGQLDDRERALDAAFLAAALRVAVRLGRLLLLRHRAARLRGRLAAAGAASGEPLGGGRAVRLPRTLL